MSNSRRARLGRHEVPLHQGGSGRQFAPIGECETCGGPAYVAFSDGGPERLVCALHVPDRWLSSVAELGL